MDINNKYLIDCDIDFNTLKHEIGLKTICSYDSYADRIKGIHNELFTIYMLLNPLIRIIERTIVNENMSNPLRKGVSYFGALIKIVKSMNGIFYDMVITLSLSNMYMVTYQSYRQMVEYFVAFFLLLKSDEELSAFYLNYGNILEMKGYKQQDNANYDLDLKTAYKKSVELFASYHKLTYEKAEKIYSKPFGWAYGFVKNVEGENVEYITSKLLRESFIDTDKIDIKSLETMHKSIKTCDLVVHPTPVYLYYLSRDSNSLVMYQNTIFNSAIKFFSGVLLKSIDVFELRDKSYNIVHDCIKRIEAVDKNIFNEYFEFEKNYDLIKKVKKNKSRIEDPVLKLKNIYDNYESNNNQKISYIDSLSYSYFKMSFVKKHNYKHLDIIYAFTDIYNMNLNEFVIKEVGTNPILLNFCQFYWILSFMLHELTVAYAFNKVTLFQKIFRLFVEYVAVADLLVNSNIVTNKNFFDSGYLHLKQTFLEKEVNENEFNKALHEIKDRMQMENNKYDGQILDIFGWTIRKVGNKFYTDSISHIIELFGEKIDPKNKAFKQIFSECNATLHGCLFSGEINNDIIKDSTITFAYVLVIYNSFIELNKSFSRYLNDTKNKKLIDSNNLITFELMNSAKAYNKKMKRMIKKHS